MHYIEEAIFRYFRAPESDGSCYARQSTQFRISYGGLGELKDSCSSSYLSRALGDTGAHHCAAETRLSEAAHSEQQETGERRQPGTP